VALLMVPLLVSVAAACSGSDGSDSLVLTAEAKTGQDLWRSKGCSNCHTINGSRSEGPTWKGLYGSTVTLREGTTVKADDAYLTQSINDPNSQIVKGYSPLMPKTQMSADEIAAVLAFLKALA
jgi:cytochrome c oxidase subunit 2